MHALERVLKTLIAAIAVACALTAPTVHAAATANEVADLWWTTSESGWGIQLSQQHETVFATMYVYGPDGSPDFYVAVLDPASAVAWSGVVYRTSGPWFGGPFNPAAVTENVVGSMTFTLKSFYNAELAYTIDGTPVVKTVTRFSFANDHVGGNYYGAATATTLSGTCPSTGPVPVVVQFTHAGGVPFTGVVATAASTCTMTGSYGQRGRYGDVFGTYSCTNGESGTGAITSIAVTHATVTFHFRFDGTGPGYACVYEGDFGGTRG